MSSTAPLHRTAPRRLTACLAVLFIVAFAAACSSNNNKSNTTTANAPSAPASATTAATVTAATPATTSAATTGAQTAAATPRTTPVATPAVAASSLSGTVTVLAASSLTDAFNQEGQAFQLANPKVTVKFSYGASSALEAQLAQGAPADLFASADQANMDKATQANVIDGRAQVFAKNKVVVIYPKNNPANIQSVADLAKPGVKLVLTDPSVPIGAYARTVLKNLSQEPAYGGDFSDKVLANDKSDAADVRSAVAAVQTGQADATICYATDVTPSAQKDVTEITIPDKDNVIATYPIATVKGAQNKTAAQAFIAFVRSAPGQAILKGQGFILDGDTGVQARSVAHPAARLAYEQTAVFSDTFTIDGLVNNPHSFTYDDLAALPSETETVSFQGPNGVETHTYTGVKLYDLLQAAGPQTDPARKNDLIRFYVQVTAADGYTAIVAWAELDPFSEGKDVLIAYQENGQPLGAGRGMARLVVPGDGHGARYVSAITEITLGAAPEPGS
jgi:molybdate transport system substrate-binding protein